MLVNEVEAVHPEHEMPRLPVARVLWDPYPDMQVAAQSWIHAGGAHHTGFSMAITGEYMEDFAAIAGIEYLIIDSDTKLREFKNEIKWNSFYYE